MTLALILKTFTTVNTEPDVLIHAVEDVKRHQCNKSTLQIDVSLENWTNESQ